MIVEQPELTRAQSFRQHLSYIAVPALLGFAMSILIV
jgi:hypothetical protein